jgi:hypothetical protein
MVDIIDAYRSINKSVLRVADDLVPLTVLEEDARPTAVRLDEAVYEVAETQQRLADTVVVAHDLGQYTNKFYSITLNTNSVVWLDYLVNHTYDEIDLTEFGEYI